MASRPAVSLTSLGRAEVANAIYRYVFRAAITRADARVAWENFERDRVTGVWSEVELPVSLWDACIHIAHRYGPILGVRTLDSLHVACAMELKADKFWTFDERQQKLAEAVGLDVKP